MRKVIVASAALVLPALLGNSTNAGDTSGTLQMAQASGTALDGSGDATTDSPASGITRQGRELIDSNRVAPVGSDSIDPVGSDSIDPIGSDSIDPIGSDSIDPVGSDSIDPIGSDTAGGPSQRRLESFRSLNEAPDIDGSIAGGFQPDDLIGRRIVGPDGRPLGEISGVLIDSNGEASRVLVDSDSSLGIGVRQVPMSISELTQADDQFVAPITVDQMRSSPSFRARGDDPLRQEGADAPQDGSVTTPGGATTTPGGAVPPLGGSTGNQ